MVNSFGRMEISRHLSRVLAKSANACSRASKILYQSSSEARVATWFRDQGDKTLRLDYELDEHSLVFDVGGYEGQWASDIFARFRSTIHIFEPVEAFAAKIERRFSKNDRIFIHRHGLSNETKVVSIALCGDGSSIVKSASKSEKSKLIRALDFMHQNNISTIDLIKINVEGGEYELLDHLIETGFVQCIDNIQVQFHDFVPDAEARMTQIQKNLACSHFLTYQYTFIWENWKRR